MKLSDFIRSKRFSVFTISVITIILAYFTYTGRWLGDDKSAWRRIVDSDGRGYYAYLPAVLIFHDMKFDFIKEQEDTIYGKGSSEYLYLQNGNRGNKYFIGVSIFLLPFFLLATLVSYCMGLPITGYNPVYFGSISIASLFYLAIALYYIRKFLKLYNIRDVWISVMFIMLVFGTNIYYFSVYAPSNSHIFSFCAISVFVYNLKKFELENKKSFLLTAAVALSLITLLRPINIIVVLAVPFLCGSWERFLGLINNILKNKLNLILCILIYSGIVFLQPLMLYFTYGGFFHWPYEGESFDFLNPHFLDTLFSYRKGLFIYTPLMFLAIISIFFKWKKNIFSIASFFLFFIILNYIFSSWCAWDYGGSYGLRAFIEFYPIFIIPLSISLNEVIKKWKLMLIAVLFISLIIVSLIQTYQYQKQIIIAEMTKEIFWKVFLKTGLKNRNVAIPIINIEPDEKNIAYRSIILNNFEGVEDWGADNTITEEDCFSPKHSVKISNEAQFSPSYMKSFKDLSENKVSFVKVTMRAKLLDGKAESALIVSFEKADQQVFSYNNYPILMDEDEIGNWKKINYCVRIPYLSGEGVMKVYGWNFTKYPVFIDDMQVELITLKQ